MFKKYPLSISLPGFFTAPDNADYILLLERPGSNNVAVYIDDVDFTYEDETYSTVCTWYISDSYRFGFNGKEKTDEWNGEGNIYDYGFRIYDPRIARFLSVDPLTSNYPFYTPYQYASNTPIQAIDIDGLEGAQIVSHQYNTTTIYVDLVYYRKSNNGYSHLSAREARAIKSGMMYQFKLGGHLVDKNHIDENGNFYTVNLIINLVEVPTENDAITLINTHLDDPKSTFILIWKSPAIPTTMGGSNGIIKAAAVWSSIWLSDPLDSHTNLHELFHDFIHDNVNASDDLRCLIDKGGDQIPGHRAADGIFIYADPNKGIPEQNLNQKNIDDALQTLPVIEIHPIKMPSILKNERPEN